MNYQSEPVTMWFDRRLAMRKSPIHGVGTFATEPIPAGQLLMVVTGGVVYTPEDWHTGRVQLEGDMYNEESLPNNQAVATPKALHYYINHSCEPNAVDLSRHPMGIQYVALRDIRTNEEITADYYDETSLEVCKCNSAHCRWKRQE